MSDKPNPPPLYHQPLSDPPKVGTPGESESPPPATNNESTKGVYDDFPWVTYGSAVLCGIVLVLSFAFYGYLADHGGVPARRGLAEWVEGHSRASIQLVTMLSSFLAAILKFGLGKAFTFIAQKRFLKFRTVFEAEIWMSLKNRGIIWPWTERTLRRWKAMPITLLVVAMCGTLTSVFVSLLSPLRVPLHDRISGELELDFSLASPRCGAWFDNNILRVRNRTCETWESYKDFKYQRCDTASQLLDVLEAGKASMLAYIDTKAQPSGHSPTSISALGRLGNTRILGSTAGVVPMGFAGINAFHTKTSSGRDVDSSLSNTPYAPKPNYTLTLQGFSTEVSCEYIEPSQLPYTWPPVLNTVDGVRRVTVNCSTVSSGFYQAAVAEANNSLLVYECKRPSGYAWDYYLHSFFDYNEPISASVVKAYAGIGAMKCSVIPRLRNIQATFHSHTDAFTMDLTDDVGAVPTVDMFQSVAEFAWYIFGNAQTLSAGNLVAYLIDTWAVSRLGLPGGARHEGYPAVVANMLKGIFEYQASNLRMLLQTSQNRAPDECFRRAEGTVEYFVIGWGPSLATTLGFIPLGLVGVLIFSLLIWARSGKLVLFDPTSPVSLIAAASAKGVSFAPGRPGDPEDKDVRKIRVRYGPLDAMATQWGLVKDTGSTEEGEGVGVGVGE